MITRSFITVFALLVGTQAFAELSALEGPASSDVSTVQEEEPYSPGWCDAKIETYGFTEEKVKLKTIKECPFEFHEFDCSRVTPSTDPLAGSDVRHLRPEDIKIALAIGDSMTAGFGIETLPPIFGTVPRLPKEFRGKVFSVGSDPHAYSVFNFLKEYNKDLRGGSGGTTRLWSEGKELNMAQTGAKAKELPGQVDNLIDALKSPTYAGLRDDWKMLTLLIGANDICSDVCRTGLEESRISVENGVREALEKARIGMPKMHVNLMGLFQFSELRTPQDKSGYCRTFRSIVRFCKCNTSKLEVRKLMQEAVNDYNKIFEKIAGDYKDKYDDFNVVYQPAYTKLGLEEHELALLSGFDCYHPNDCAAHAMAFGLWNNLWMSPEEKYETVHPAEQKIVCPTGNAYLK